MTVKRICFVKMCDDQPTVAGRRLKSDVLACVHHEHKLDRTPRIPLTPENIVEGFMDANGNTYVNVKEPPIEDL